VDGGVLNPVPVNRVKRSAGDLLVAVNVNAFIPLERGILTKEQDNDWIWFEKLNKLKLKGFQMQFHHNGNSKGSKKNEPGYFNMLTKTSSIMLNRITELTFELTPPDLLIEVSRDVSGIFDFYKASELIEAGRKAAKKAIMEKRLTN